MSEPSDIVRVREELKRHARFRGLPEARKVKLFQGMRKIREWLNDDLLAGGLQRLGNVSSVIKKLS